MTRFACLTLTAALASAALHPAAAQTNLGLMTTPWGASGPVDGRIGGLGLSSDADGGGSVDLAGYDASLRFRPAWDADPAGDDSRFTLGLEAAYLDLDADSGLPLPTRLTDQALAAGSRVGGFAAFDRRWAWGVSGGFGHASSDPFDDPDGWYGLGAVHAVTQVGAAGSLMLGIDYDGNRPILPDTPLPAISYAAPLNDTTFLVLGFPVTSINWSPNDRLTARVSLFGINPSARVSYALDERVELFARYGSDQLSSRDADDDPDRRIFYTSQVVEAGVALESGSPLSLTISGGFAFDQAFERGFDLRDTDDLVELDDAGFFRIAAGLSF